MAQMKYQEYLDHFAQYLTTQNLNETVNAAENFKKSVSNVIVQNSDVVYENDDFKLLIVKRLHKKNIRFKLQDSVFEIKTELKKSANVMPKLQNLLDILAEALVIIIKTVQSYFPSIDENIAYFTIHQSPMMRGIKMKKLMNFLLINTFKF